MPRLKIVLAFLQNFKKFEENKRITKTNFPSSVLFPHLKAGLDGNAADLRQVSQQTLVSIYKIFGWEYVEPFVSELSVKNLSILEKEIPECKQYVSVKKSPSKLAN